MDQYLFLCVAYEPYPHLGEWVNGCQLDEPYMASLVTTGRMQQCFDVLIDINHEFLLLFYCCVLLEIKLTTTK